MKWFAILIIATIMTPLSQSSARADLGARGPVVQMTSNLSSTCLVLEDGSVKCSEAKLSDGPPVFLSSYTKIQLGFAVKQIVPAYSFTCAISVGGDIYCWYKFSPSSSSKPNLRPLPVRLPLNQRAQELSVHESFYSIEVCALTEQQNIFCWEVDPQKNKFPSFVPSPKAIVGLANVVDIDGKCAVKSSGSVVCWEDNRSFRTTPVGAHLWAVDELNDAQTISTTTDHGCAITKSKTLKCWGNNEVIGIPIDENSFPGEVSFPTELPNIADVVKVSTRPQSTCVLLATSRLYCWGHPFNIFVEGTQQTVRTPKEVFSVEAVEDIGVSSSNNGGPYMISTKWNLYLLDLRNDDAFHLWSKKLDEGVLYSSSLITGIELSSPLRVGLRSSAEFTYANGSSEVEVINTFEKVCRWSRDGKSLAAGNVLAFTPKPTDAGHKFTVSCTAKNGLFFDRTFTTPTTIVRLGLQSSSGTSTPIIVGTTKSGQTLTARAGTWDSGVALSYQWLRNGVAVKGATKATYKLVAADQGKKITVRVTGSKAGYLRVVKISSAKTISK